jgi:hypothetical protein
VVHVLTLATAGAPPLECRPLIQAIASLPAPGLPGLLARHWRVDGRRLQGRYFFDDRERLDAFVRDQTADPALALIRAEAAAPQPHVVAVETVDAADAADVLDRPVFVVCAPRAGSTLLQETLAHAAAIWTLGGEGQGVIEGIPALHPSRRGYASHRLVEDDAAPETVQTLRAGYLAELRDRRGRRWIQLPSAARPRQVCMLDKTPENVLRIPFLRAAFPDARFVLLHRDVRPNVSSILAAWQHAGFTNIPELPGWDRGRWCFLLPPGWRSLNGSPLSDVAAMQWRKANEQALDDLDSVSRECWTSISYQELVTAPDPAIRRLCEFLDVAVDSVLADVLSRDLPLSSTTITPPSPIKWRSNADLLPSSFNYLGLVAGRLRSLTTTREALRAAAQPERPPVLDYACFLDAVRSGGEDGRGALVVHPSLHVQIGVSVPLGLAHRARFRERFLPDHPVLWVEDPATRVLQPFWARRGDVPWLRELVPGNELPPSLGDELVGPLRRAGILVRPGEVEDRRAQGEAQLAGAGDELARNRHTRLCAVLHPDQLSALAAYYRRLVSSGRWEIGDGQVERRHGWHNERMARFLHHQLTWFVGQVAREPVKPTYAYSSAYRGGAALDAHIDREQCDYTMSLLLDQSPGLESDPWPLWFAAPEGKAFVTLSPGDAALFRGCELPHWREAAPPEHEQTMLLFHYVPVGFAGVVD